jgi:hypothetical protein
VRSRLVKYIFNKAIVVFSALRLKFLPKNTNVHNRRVGIVAFALAVFLGVGRDWIAFNTLGFGAVCLGTDNDIRVHLLTSEVLKAHKSDIWILSFFGGVAKAFDFGQAFQFLFPFKRKVK